MLQQDKPDDFVVATGDVHSVREFVEKAFKHVGKSIVWVHRHPIHFLDVVIEQTGAYKLNILSWYSIIFVASFTYILDTHTSHTSPRVTDGISLSNIT